MANKMTDELNLVQTATVKGFLGLFSRTIGVADGFSLEVFRGDTHLGSILSNDIKLASDVKKRFERLGARDGDTILRINLGPRTFKMSGKLYTRDGYARDYEIILELRVSNPLLFAERYRQQSDPISLAQTAIEGEFQKYAERNVHDAMDPANLRFQAERTLAIETNKRIGVEVTRAHKSLLGMDPKRRQELEFRQKAQVKKVEVETTTEVEKFQTEREAEVQDIKDDIERRRVREFADFVRAEEAKQQDYERLEVSKQQLHVRRENLFNMAAKEAMASLSERIREEIAMGRSLSEVFNDYPELRDIFLAPSAGVLPTAEREAIAGPPTDGTTKNGINTSAEDILIQEDTEAQPVVKPQKLSGIQRVTVREEINSVIHIAQFGIALIPTTLSTEQCGKLGLADDTAFIIIMVDKDGPSQKAGLRVSDILVEINGQPLPDAKTMKEMFDANVSSTSITVKGLRGETIINLPISLVTEQ